MAALVTTLATHVTAPVNYVLMKGLLSAARKKLPYFNGTLPGTLEKNQGSLSVEWQRINNLTAATTALGEFVGTAAFLYGRSLVQPTVSNITVATAKYGNALQVTEELDFTQVNTRAAKFLDTLGANAGESLNTLMYDVYNGSTQVRYSTGAAGGGAAGTAGNLVSNVAASISVGDIKYGVNLLNANSAQTYTPIGLGSTTVGSQPIRSSYYGICHVDVEEDIRSLTGFIPVEQYGGYTDTMPFEFGAVGGVRWSSTQVGTIWKSSVTKTVLGYRNTTILKGLVYTTFIYGKEAIGTVGLGNMHASNSYEMYNPKTPPAVEVIYKSLGSSGVADPYNEIASLAWKAWFAGKILNATWVVKVKSFATSL